MEEERAIRGYLSSFPSLLSLRYDRPDWATPTPSAHTPRNVNIITGASGTTDIEGSYVRGAHGPGFLHVVLVEDLA